MVALAAAAGGVVVLPRAAVAQPACVPGDSAQATGAEAPATPVATDWAPAPLSAPGSASRCITRSPGALPPLTFGVRRRAYLRTTFGPGTVVGLLPAAAVTHLLDVPEEWGRGWPGYGRRYASAIGARVVRETLLFGAGAAFGEDRRYQRLGSGPAWRRVGHSFGRAAAVRTANGARRLCRSCLAAALGTGAARSAWWPRRDRGAEVGRVAAFAAGELAGFALGALGAEFVPDLRRAAARVVGR